MYVSKHWSVKDWDCYGREQNYYAWDNEDGKLCTDNENTANLFKILDNLYEQDPSIMVNWTAYKPQFGMALKSGYRDERANLAVGGEPNSYHTRGCAADIHFADHDYTAEQIAEKVLITASWFGLENSLGIGLYDGWCHIDTRGYTSRW